MYKIDNVYLYNSIVFKNIKMIRDYSYVSNQCENNISNLKYSEYYITLQKLDNYYSYELNSYELNKNNFLNLDSPFYKYNKLFNLNNNSNTLKQIIIEQHVTDLSSRKMSNNLTKPHYFFTYRYNEKSMPSQIKHWTSSVYNFLSSEKAGNNYKDIYTSKFIKLFFNIKYLKKVNFWDYNRMVGLKIKSRPFFIPNINNMIKYTSKRSSLSIRKLISYPRQFLTLDWVAKQYELSTYIKDLLIINRSDFSGGNYSKKKKYIRKMKRILISKPLFKHTSFNLIIDLFVFNNKKYMINRINNIVLRRSMYKYMYSMYINCYDKIKETINRPRFFYINLIEPKIHKYYDWIIKYYGELIIMKKKPMLLFLYLLLLQINFVNKLDLNSVKNNIFNIINRNINQNIRYNHENINKCNIIDNSSLISNRLDLNNKEKYNTIFKRRSININYNNVNSYKYFLKKENKLLYNLNKNVKENIKQESSIIIQNKKKIIKNRRSLYIHYKKYLVDLERKSNSPIDLNTLSLWNTKRLGKHYRTPLGIIDESSNKFKNKKTIGFSYNSYNNKNSIKYNENNTLYISKGKKKNSDLWYKRRNKLITNKNWDLINKKYWKANNNLSLIYDIKNIFNYKKDEININFISKNEEEKIIKLENNQNYNSSNALGIKQYIYNIRNMIRKNTLAKNLFISFYVYYNNSKLNKRKNNIMCINIENYKKIKLDSYKKSKLHYLNNNIPFNYLSQLERRWETNSKIIWDKLDNSLIGALSKHININKKMLFGFNSFQINSLLNEIKKFKGFDNLWYLMYFINIIKKEFYIINRDIIVPKSTDIRPNLFYKKNYTYIYDNNKNFEYKVFNYVNENYKTKLHIWPSILSNKREKNINFKFGYNENIFKPYYRYMIPFFILNSYYIIIKGIGYLNPLYYISSYLNKTFNGIKHNNVMLFNFLTIKILLDLLHYNYRSWIRVKSRYYYLSKLRLFERKLWRLTVNSWLTSLRYLKKLRKTPNKFWLRYNKGAAIYFNRIIQYAELDTKRKIFVPFVLYFEDILFSIYGKWVIIRLWPLKRFFLSSYILANRVLLLLLWHRKKNGRQTRLGSLAFKLITAFKAIEVKKTYEFYIKNATAWPVDILLKMNNYNKAHSFKYNNLEFFNAKQNRLHYLNTYNLFYNNIFNYLPIMNFNYNLVFEDYIKYLNNTRFRPIMRNKLSKYQHIYYWLLPFKNYIMKLTRSIDITGIKFKIAGRPSFKRSNNRKVLNIYNHGNRLIPRLYFRKINKYISFYTPKLRGYLRSNIESHTSISKTRNGSVSLKVWISSLLSIDVHELLLHLVRIKGLYYQLVNRIFHVPELRSLSNNYQRIKLYKNKII